MRAGLFPQVLVLPGQVDGPPVVGKGQMYKTKAKQVNMQLSSLACCRPQVELPSDSTFSTWVGGDGVGESVWGN